MCTYGWGAGGPPRPPLDYYDAHDLADVTKISDFTANRYPRGAHMVFAQ